MQSFRIIFYCPFNDPRRAVIRIVVDNKDVGLGRGIFKNSVYKSPDVFGFVVGWNANK
jgi:hypothetical protein